MLENAPAEVVNAVFLPPSILKEIARTPSVLEKMRRIDWVGFGGG
jgi:hypothetical protein